MTGTVEIKNTGTIDSKLSLQESGDTSTFAAGGLNLVIKQDGATLYNGDFGGYANTVQDLGDLDAGVTSTFTFIVSMPANASNANQDKDAARDLHLGHHAEERRFDPPARTGSDRQHGGSPSGDGGTRRMGNMGGSWPARLGGSRAGHPH